MYLSVELALARKLGILGPNPSDAAKITMEIIENPSRYLGRLALSDIDQIFTCHGHNTDTPFYDEAALLRKAAKHGLVEIIERAHVTVSFYDQAPAPQPLVEEILRSRYRHRQPPEN
jgi:hypothetical protein